MLLDKLYEHGLIHPPKWLLANCHYLTQIGSTAYGVSGDSSDLDIYGFCIPPKDNVFPHLAGEIAGFGQPIQRFEQWQEHHIRSPDKLQEYDFQVFGIVRYFQLLMDNNPNIIDSLFTPRRCVLHATHIAELLREKRQLFLHKGAFHKFKGYAYSQMSKIQNKVNSSSPKRAADIERFGYDTKFAYHVVRLANECEQILVEGDLDLERNREQLKSIRRGEWTLEQLMTYFTEKERILEMHYASSPLPHAPDEAAIKDLLLTCLEAHYGNLDRVIQRNPSMERLLDDLHTLVERYGGKATRPPQ